MVRRAEISLARKEEEMRKSVMNKKSREMRVWMEALIEFGGEILPALLVAGAALLPWIILCTQ